MNKFFQTILIFSIAVFGAGFLVPPSTFAQATNLVVQFSCGSSNCPIFGEVNFAPGETTTGWAKVTNNSGSTQKIATETINESDPNHLADKLNFTIKQGETVLYDDTLANFFAIGEKYLSDLANGVQTRYDFTVTFDPATGDDFQGKTLGFDIIIGFQGQEGGSAERTGGGGLPSSPSGLTISSESVVEILEDSVTITWLTSYFSTSQVVYSRWDEPHTLDLTKPNYGYAHATDENLEKVISHSVTVTGLTPGTTYYFRTVSHGSLAISREYTFTTRGVAGAETISSQPESSIIPSQVLGEETGPEEEETFAAEKQEISEETAKEIKGGIAWWVWLIIVLLVVAAYIFWTSRKKKPGIV